MEAGTTGMSLEALGVDVLRGVCQMIDDAPPDESADAGSTTQKPLAALSKTSRMLRELSAPALFKEVVIRGDWKKSLKMLDKLKDCRAVTEYTKTFKFDIYVTNNQAHKPPKKLAPLLAEVVKQMKKLSKIVLVVPEYHTEAFEEAFKEAEIDFKSVEVLVVGPYCEFMVGMCPNVTTVATNGWSWLHSERQRSKEIRREHTINLMKAIQAVENVTRLEINEWWNVKLLGAILELKNLQYLAMEGRSYEQSISEFLPLLSKMTTLHTLAVSDASNLGVGFHPPVCGTVYMEPGGQKYLEQVIQEGREAEERVASMVCEAFGPHLKQLWVGDGTRFEILRDEEGVLEQVVTHYEERGKIVSYPSP